MTEQEEQELAELIVEFSEQLKEQVETIGELADKVEALGDRLAKIEERLKKLEPDETLEQFKKLLEEQKSAPAPSPPPIVWPPVNPSPINPSPSPWPSPAPIWPDPNLPLIGTPTNKCSVCGIDFGNGSGWGYVCNHLNCPTRVYAISSTAPAVGPLTTTTIKFGEGTTTCECGQNSTCQCNS